MGYLRVVYKEAVRNPLGDITDIFNLQWRDLALGECRFGPERSIWERD